MPSGLGSRSKLLSDGLAPFVERECKAHYGDGWLDEVVVAVVAPVCRRSPRLTTCSSCSRRCGISGGPSSARF